MVWLWCKKQPLHKRMAQHRRANSSGQDSAVYLHLKDRGHSFEDHQVHILDREDGWFERGVKEAIYTRVEKPSLNRGGGLRHHLSPTYNAVLSSLPRKLNKRNLLGSGEVANDDRSVLASGDSNDHGDCRYSNGGHWRASGVDDPGATPLGLSG